MEGEGWKVRGWKVRGWRVRGYEVVRIGRLLMLKITHNLCSPYSSPCCVPPLLTFALGYLLLCCHSNPSTAEGKEDGGLTDNCDSDLLITRLLEVEGDPVATLLWGCECVRV